MGVLASGYGVMFTMLDDWRAEFGIQETGLSMIIAVGFFTSFIAQLTIAPYADRGHARKLMTVGMAANAAGALIMAFGSSLPLFLLGRFVMGVGAGIAIPAIKRIVIVSDPENMGGNLGRGVSIEVGGFAIGPVIAALTVDSINLAAPFILIAVLITIAGAIIARLNITETAVEDRTEERFAIDLLKNRAVLGSILVGVALYVMIGVYDSLWVIMMDDLKAPHWIGNAGVALFGLPWIFFGALGGRIAQKHGPLRVSAFGLALGALYMTSYGFMTMPYLMLSVGLTQSILDSLTVTGIGVAVAQATPPERQAGASGLLRWNANVDGWNCSNVCGHHVRTLWPKVCIHSNGRCHGNTRFAWLLPGWQKMAAKASPCYCLIRLGLRTSRHFAHMSLLEICHLHND